MKLTKQIEITIFADGNKCNAECKFFYDGYCNLFSKILRKEFILVDPPKQKCLRCKKCIKEFGDPNERILN
jgi:hypothetical protein